MTPRISRIARFLVIAFIAGIAGALPAANAAVPADIAERLRQTASTWQTSVDQQQQMQRLTGGAPSATMARDMNRRVYSSMMAQAVIEAIARNPADALDVTNAAINAAPDLRSEILSNVSAAFPTMGAVFAASAQPGLSDRTATAVPRAPPGRQNEADRDAAGIADKAADNDPLENFNRAVFAFNDFLDSYLLVPIARAYRFVMPEPIREMGRNFFENLNEPVVVANNLLQGEFSDAGVAVGRFVVNSTAGLFGFFEVAEELDLEQETADFGQTLHTYGVGSGPFLMLPFFGPSTIRDTVGTGVDTFFNPIAYLLDFETRMYLKASEIVVKREEVLDPVDELRKGSVDFYAAVRSAWQQNRAEELRKGKPPPIENLDELFEDVK